MLHRKALALTVGSLVLAGGALLVPSVAVASSSAGSSAAQPSGHARHRLLTPAQRRELRHTGHVTTSKAHKHQTVAILVQRGVILAVTPTSIWLSSKDGFTHSYAITPKTRVLKHGKAGSASHLFVGEQAIVLAVRTGRGDVARRITGLRNAAGTTP